MAKASPEPGAQVRVKFVSLGKRVRKLPLRDDQKHFPQDGLALEYWGVALFGYEREEFFDRETGQKVNKPKSATEAMKAERRTTRAFHKSKDISDMKFWKDLYVRTFEVLHASIFRSIGSIDKSHRKAIDDELTRALTRLRSAEGKDSIHAELIASLFRLVFLLLGRSAYPDKGKRRNFSTFRTLTYSQTEEQLSWLLKGYIHTSLATHGFDHFIDADLAFAGWAKARRKPTADASTFVEWVRETFPETYNSFV